MHAGRLTFAAVAAISGFAILSLGGCSRDSEPKAGESDSTAPGATAALPAPNPDRNAYFGAVHVHTGWSFDAMTNGSQTTPTDAYAWAQGREITNSGVGGKIQIRTPLDFYMVSDHAEYMGVFNQMSNPDSPISKTEIAKGVTSPDANVRLQTFAGVLRDMSAGKSDPALSDPVLARSVWSDIVKAAEENYQPGKFTTFAGFEWTSNPNKRNLHRVVVFRDTKTLPEMALSALDSDDPETLWKWMGQQRERGSTLLAIPHNGNASDGRMFELVKFDGKPIDAAYNATRAANEPLYEITQIKGTSETHPALSSTDEFAGFELWDYTLSADAERPTHREGSFARKALLDGLSQEQAGRGNPFKYGFIGDTDTHNAAATNEEFNYTGKFAFENDAKHRLNGLEGQPPEQLLQIQEFSSGGLAGVWAEQNTREAIYDAMLRKETFATSGPMIKVRLLRELGPRRRCPGAAGLRQAGLRRRRAHGRRPASVRGRRQGADLLRHRAEGPGERQPRSRADREGLARREGRPAGARLRRDLERRPQARCGRQAAGRRRYRGCRQGQLHQQHRRAAAVSGLDRPGVQAGRAGVLLRARARDPDAALEHDRRREARRRRAEGAAGQHPGTRLELADLVRAEVISARRAPRMPRRRCMRPS